MRETWDGICRVGVSEIVHASPSDEFSLISFAEEVRNDRPAMSESISRVEEGETCPEVFAG